MNNTAMNRFSYVFTGLVAAACLLWTTPSLLGQTVIDTNGETTITVQPEKQLHIFHLTVKHDGFMPLQLYVVRKENDLPDPTWSSAVCMDDYCYAPTVDSTTPVNINPGTEYPVSLYVFFPDTAKLGEQARVTLVFKTSPSGDAIEEITFNTTTSTSGVPMITTASELASPNPAVSDVTLPLTSVSDVQSVTVFNLLGETVETYTETDVASDKLRLDLTEYRPGVYYYQITGMTESKFGSFTVAR